MNESAERESAERERLHSEPHKCGRYKPGVQTARRRNELPKPTKSKGTRPTLAGRGGPPNPLDAPEKASVRVTYRVRGVLAPARDGPPRRGRRVSPLTGVQRLNPSAQSAAHRLPTTAIGESVHKGRSPAPHHASSAPPALPHAPAAPPSPHGPPLPPRRNRGHGCGPEVFDGSNVLGTDGEWIPCSPEHLTALLTHTEIVEEAERIVAGHIMLN